MWPGCQMMTFGRSGDLLRSKGLSTSALVILFCPHPLGHRGGPRDCFWCLCVTCVAPHMVFQVALTEHPSHRKGPAGCVGYLGTSEGGKGLLHTTKTRHIRPKIKVIQNPQHTLRVVLPTACIVEALAAINKCCFAQVYTGPLCCMIKMHSISKVV